MLAFTAEACDRDGVAGLSPPFGSSVPAVVRGVVSHDLFAKAYSQTPPTYGRHVIKSDN